MYMLTNRCTNICMYKLLTLVQTDKHTQTDKQTDKHTQTNTYGQTYI